MFHKTICYSSSKSLGWKAKSLHNELRDSVGHIGPFYVYFIILVFFPGLGTPREICYYPPWLLLSFSETMA